MNKLLLVSGLEHIVPAKENQFIKGDETKHDIYTRKGSEDENFGNPLRLTRVLPTFPSSSPVPLSQWVIDVG